jgi:hypothetical protein
MVLFGAMTLDRMAFCKMILRITTLQAELLMINVVFFIVILGVILLNVVMLSVIYAVSYFLWHSECHCTDCQYAECLAPLPNS